MKHHQPTRPPHCRGCVLTDLCADAGSVVTLHLTPGQELPLGRRRNEVAAVRVVCSGSLKTLVEREGCAGADGRTAIVAVHLPGETVHPARGRRRQVRHLAVEPTVVRATAGEVPAGSPLWLNAWDDSVQRAERDCARIASLASQSPPERLATMLVDLIRRRGGRPRSAVSLPLPLSREEVAAYLGITPETVSRAFRRLREQGLIQRRRWSRVEVPDLPAVARYAGVAT